MSSELDEAANGKIRSNSLGVSDINPDPGAIAKTPKPLNALEHERLAKAQRENQQILIYLFVVTVIAMSWALGMLGCSFLWIFGLIALTFLVWWGKVLHLTEEHVKYQELLLHRKRALRHNETAEWFNFVLNRWWVFSQTSISNMVKKSLDPLLMTVKPAFVESIELGAFSLGECTPFVQYVKVFEVADGGKKPMSWMNINQPPPGLPQAQYYQAVVEADVGLQSEDFKMIFRTRLGGKWMGMNMDIAVEKLNISGKMQFLINLNMDAAFPHISTVSMSFLEKPEVWFAIRVLRAVQMMEIPVLKSWIHSLVMDGLTQALVDPGKVDIRLESSGPTYAPAKSRSKAKAMGVLTITVHTEHTKGTKSSGLYDSIYENFVNNMFTDDIRYCTLRLGEQKQHTQETQGIGTWQDACSFLVDDLKTDHLLIKSKSKRLLSTYTLAQFDVALADFPFEHKPVIDTTLDDEKSKTLLNPGQTKINLTLEYTALKSVNMELISQADQPAPVSEVAGVMYVSVHSAQNLLALDRNGFSDPYCIIFSNGKKIKTTHYICRTRNPSWEVSTEFIVRDFTKTMLSFLVYDWDGHNATDDDFLGSAYILLSLDEHCVIKRSLTLGYNLQRVGQVDNMKLGTITVSAVFRPVASVAKSEDNITVTNISYQEYQASRQKNFINSAKSDLATKNKFSVFKDKGVGDLLSLGYGILELNIKQAKDLVPMDSNGFSDPYVEVRIASERKFTTSIKKKTLNPVWDEWVTLQMPRPQEILEIVVWDRDPFFKKDFLGSISFSVEELKSYSNKPVNDGWIQLQRIRSGYIQLFFNVISEDVNSGGSESADSGVHPSSASGSPREEDVNKGNSPRLHSNMSPIHETAVDANNGSRINPPESDEVFITPTESESQSPTHAPLTEPPTRSQRMTKSASHTLDTRAVSRSASDANIKEKRAKAATLSSSQRSKSESSPMPTLRKTDSSSLPSQFTSRTSLPARLDKHGKHRFWNKKRTSTLGDTASLNGMGGIYYNVRGHLTKVEGLQTHLEQVYCKIRLDKHNFDERRSKYSSGRVICKSPNVDFPGNSANMDLFFEVDKGNGISGESVLIFDLKTSKRNHLATRHIRLNEVLNDNPGKDQVQWIDLGQGIKIEVTLSHGSPKERSSSRHSKLRSRTPRS